MTMHRWLGPAVDPSVAGQSNSYHGEPYIPADVFNVSVSVCDVRCTMCNVQCVMWCNVHLSAGAVSTPSLCPGDTCNSSICCTALLLCTAMHCCYALRSTATEHRNIFQYNSDIS